MQQSICYHHSAQWHQPRPLAAHRSRRRATQQHQCHAAAPAPASQTSSKKHRVVFLGTPEVAATVLQRLLTAARQPSSQFEVSKVVSQPGKPKGRGNKSVPVPSPVELEAQGAGMVSGKQIWCPASAKDPAFLEALRQLQPDLCVTAAYGNILPQAFLDIPQLGTLNIHPSLLPKYRGAAPVQRALCDGVPETGVSVAYTVLKCDAGPVLAQQKVDVDPDIQAPELLQDLFARGAALLLEALPGVFEGRGPQISSPQEEQQATHAAKLTREEARLDFSRSALSLHNTVRGFAGWPGTSAGFLLRDKNTGSLEPTEIKIVRTRALDRDVDLYKHLQSEAGPISVSEPVPGQQGMPVMWDPDTGDMLLPCQQGGSILRACVVQPPTKKAIAARDFRNGLCQKELYLAP